jgi:Family of unknown function (DUF5681)
MAAKTSKGSTPAPAEPAPENRTVSGQFRKGFSGNPGGRPKTKPFRDALEGVLAVAGDEGDLAVIARALCAQALAGNVQGIREVADRLDGKVPQAIAGIDDDENLTPLCATINLGRTQPQSPPETMGSVRKRSDSCLTSAVIRRPAGRSRRLSLHFNELTRELQR